jgi:N-methylhydantoinase A
MADWTGFRELLVGVDVGGTHTDVQVLSESRLVRGKALTTYDDFSRGLFEALGVAVAELGLTLPEALERTELIVNATTVVTNSLTALKGANVGVLITRGFRDAFRFAGGPRQSLFDDHLQTNPPDLVSREAIVEIDGRIDHAGTELLPLDCGQVEKALTYLVEDVNVDALAVCLLSSYANPEHEIAIGRMVEERYPHLFTSLSHRLFPVMRETRRWTTAVLNSFVHADARTYLESIDTNMRQAGFTKTLAFHQGIGGDISKGRAMRNPLALLGSGPAAGGIGAAELARQMGYKNVLLGDMGGTSFDAGLILNSEVGINKRINLGPFQTGINIVDVVSIGAGGGSLISVSDRGVPQVGPESAGSHPGPACYPNGGSGATLTDAMVALGFIDPDNYLGGRVRLDADRARSSVDASLARTFGWSVEDAAVSVYDLAVTNMANAIHEISVRKGYDPSGFVFFAYGGSLGMFAAQIAAAVGAGEVLIPRNSSVFCAQGLLASDTVLRYDRTVSWPLDDPDDLERVNRIADEMVAQALRDVLEENRGVDASSVSISRWGDFQFQGQVYELTLPMPDSLQADDVPVLTGQFRDKYERTYGEGTAWKGVTTQLVNYTVVATIPRPRIRLAPLGLSPTPSGEIEKGTRQVYLPERREWTMLRVYDDGSFTPGSQVDGPCVIDANDTTIFVPSGATAFRDGHLNYRITFASAKESA